ncbi:MAG: BRO family protein [Spirochaetota bacterium]
MNEIMSFQFGAADVRTVIIDGEPWWVAKDVCQSLGYVWDRNLLLKVPDEWKGVKRIHTPGGEQDIYCLSEQGLYFFLGRSDKIAAIPFQKWIAGSVIPAIRKTGSYSIVKDLSGGFMIPKTLSEALRLAADQAEHIERMRPKVESAEALLRCDTNMSITDAAKHFSLHPKTQVFAYLRDRGYLTARDLPAQDAINAGILSVRQVEIRDAEFKPQAVVATSQLEKWRTWLVPKIVAWSHADEECHV